MSVTDRSIGADSQTDTRENAKTTRAAMNDGAGRRRSSALLPLNPNTANDALQQRPSAAKANASNVLRDGCLGIENTTASSTRYSEFGSIHELVEDTMAAKRRSSLHASIDCDAPSHRAQWKSGYIPKQLDRRSSRHRRVSTSAVFAQRSMRSSLRTSMGSHSIAKELNFGSSRSRSYESAIVKVHKGLDLVLGKQSMEVAALMNQVCDMRDFWQRVRPEATIETTSDLIEDIKRHTEFLRTNQAKELEKMAEMVATNEEQLSRHEQVCREHEEKMRVAFSKDEELLLSKLREAERENKDIFEQKERLTQEHLDAVSMLTPLIISQTLYLDKPEEELTLADLTQYAKEKIEALENHNHTLMELEADLHQLQEANADAAVSIRDLLGEGQASSNDESLPDLVGELCEKMATIECEKENLLESNQSLAEDLEEQSNLVRAKEEELVRLQEVNQTVTVELESNLAGMDHLVQNIELHEKRMLEQASLCSELQGQVTHLRVEQENSKQARDAMKLLQEQWEDERAALLEEVECLKVMASRQRDDSDDNGGVEEEGPGDGGSKPSQASQADLLSTLNDDFRRNLLDLLQLLNDPELLQANEPLVACLGKIRDNLFDIYGSGEENTSNDATPSKQSFGQKLKYFQSWRDGSGVSSPNPFGDDQLASQGFSSPQVLEGIKARMSVEQKRQENFNLELGERISEATVALKDEFQRHISSYTSRIDALEEELAAKNRMLWELEHPEDGTPNPNSPLAALAGQATYDLSFFPEEWENELMSVLTEAALCPLEEWSQMLSSKEHMMREHRACHVRTLLDRLSFDFQDEQAKLFDLISELERDLGLDQWTEVSKQSPMDSERRVILQQAIISSLHRMQVLRQLALLNDDLAHPLEEIWNHIARHMEGISQQHAEQDVNRIIHQSWLRALGGMKAVSQEMVCASSKAFRIHSKEIKGVLGGPGSRPSSGEGGRNHSNGSKLIKPSLLRSGSDASNASSRRRAAATSADVRQVSQKRSQSCVIPQSSSLMNFSPGMPFLPGEREANLKMGQPPLREVLGPKSPTDADIRDLVSELLDYFKEEADICDLIRTIEPCSERHLQGSYRFGTKNIKLVILNDLLMVRIGGGFETFEQYFTKHFRLECFRLQKLRCTQQQQQQ